MGQLSEIVCSVYHFHGSFYDLSTDLAGIFPQQGVQNQKHFTPSTHKKIKGLITNLKVPENVKFRQLNTFRIIQTTVGHPFFQQMCKAVIL